MSALEALLMEIPEIADEMDIANRLIELREPAAAELAELRARLEKAEQLLSAAVCHVDTWDNLSEWIEEFLKGE